MFFRWLLRKIKYYLTILRVLLQGLAFATLIVIGLSFIATILYDLIFYLLLINIFFSSIKNLNYSLYEMRFLPSRYLLLPLNITLHLAIIYALSPYIPLLITTLFWPVIIALGIFVLSITLFFQLAILNPFAKINDYDFDDLQMSPLEENALVRKQETALATLKEYDLRMTRLQEEEQTLLRTIAIIKARLAPPEGMVDFITLERFNPVDTPSIVLFKEYQVNDLQWASYSNNGGNIYTCTQAFMDGYYHPKEGTPATNHPLNNQEKIFEPDKRTSMVDDIQTTQNTRYRFHTYKLLADGETPLCLELCTLSEALVTRLKARNAVKLPEAASQPSTHIRQSMFGRAEEDTEERRTSSCWSLCFS